MPLPPWPYPRLIAHRGGGSRAPENTLAAFRAGTAHGYRCFECDVKLSADGELFLMHDATLDRTTDGHGPGDALTLADLRRLDAGSWFSPNFAGEAPATLAEIVAHVLHTDSTLNLEIKPHPGQEVQTGQAVAGWLSRHWPADRPAPLLSSFRTQALIAARATMPSLPRGLLVESVETGTMKAASDLGCRVVIANHQQLTAAVVADLHAAGLRVATYTANDIDRVRLLLDWGIDSVITDNLDLQTEVTSA